MNPPVVKPPPRRISYIGERHLLDGVRELVGVPTVLGIAAVGVDAAEDAVVDGVRDLVVERVAGQGGVVDLDVDLVFVRKAVTGQEARAPIGSRSRIGVSSALVASVR